MSVGLSGRLKTDFVPEFRETLWTGFLTGSSARITGNKHLQTNVCKNNRQEAFANECLQESPARNICKKTPDRDGCHGLISESQFLWLRETERVKTQVTGWGFAAVRIRRRVAEPVRTSQGKYRKGDWSETPELPYRQRRRSSSQKRFQLLWSGRPPSRKYSRGGHAYSGRPHLIRDHTW